jgi:OFA family oxalate/formate antiporter-like MFS transporter
MYQAYGIAALVGPLISAAAGNLKLTFVISAILSLIGLIISLFIKSPFRKADSI